MGRTEFGEQQLRDCVNFSLIEYIENTYNSSVPPNSPTPCEEKTLGWDTAYYLPWLGPCQAGKYACNLFIQYKVSHPYTGKRGNFGKDWMGNNYFMFYMAYLKARKPDFHQLQSLIDLSAQGFTVVYVTNHVCQLYDFIDLYMRRRLMDELPVLKVKPNLGLHVQTTFTPASKYFLLHSEVFKEPKTNIMSALEQTEPTEYKADLEKIERALIEQFNLSEGKRILLDTLIDSYRKIYEIEDDNVARGIGLRHFMNYYLNLHWYRIPKLTKE